MTPINALFYPRGSARAEPVTISAEQTFITIAAPTWSRREPLAGTRSTSRLARTRRVLTLTDGSQLHTDDNDAIDALFPHQGLERFIDTLERHPQAIAAALLFTIAAAVLFFTHGLPWLANRIAHEIPLAAERVMGDQVLAALDETTFEPSTLPAALQTRIRDRVAQFAYGSGGERTYDIQFRALGRTANAFAIPGGTILITDQLVAELDDEDALLAVIAHEVGHHEARHVMRSVLQGSAILALTAFITADVNAAAAVVLAAPTFLLNGHYSRSFELEADTFALDLLARQNVSPEWFSYALMQIGGGATQTGNLFDYAATHPPTIERIETAKAHAHGFAPLEVIVAARDRVGSAAIDLSERMMWGCWEGSRTDGTDYASDWWVRFHEDGDLEATFAERVQDEVDTSYYTGRWAVHGSTLATRYRYRQTGTSNVDLDRLLSYTVDHIDATEMRYRRTQDDIQNQSWRVLCDSGNDAAIDESFNLDARQTELTE